MKVVMVSYHCCIRVQKEGLALAAAGHEVHYVQHIIPHVVSKYVLRPLYYYFDPQSLFNLLLDSFDDSYIFHVHNEPNFMVSVVRKAFPDARIIMDIHDITSVKKEANESELREEVQAFEDADAFIVPCEGYADRMKSYGKDTRVVYSMPAEFMLDHINLCKHPLHGLVYEGGLVCKQDTVTKSMPYRYQVPLIAAMSGYGITTAVLPANPVRNPAEYTRAGALFLKTASYVNMLQQLTRFKFGLFGWHEPHPQMQVAMPNKLFEYLAAGLPVICINAKEAGEFVESNGVGLSYEANAPSELDHVCADISHKLNDFSLYRDLHENVLRLRREYVMERHVGVIEDLYNG